MRAFSFRYNKATNCLGAGVRLGGWDVDGYAHGQGNVRIMSQMIVIGCTRYISVDASWYLLGINIIRINMTYCFSFKADP